jgi:putative ATP-dependent endonuclease of OLD family
VGDIERYLDATRAEMVFAQRVLLVEGFAEQVLVPVLAASDGVDLDKEGVTVCAIHGTHFSSYARFLEALGIRWAVITDGDPAAAGGANGERRAERLLKALGLDGDPTDLGVFVGQTTFEFDLFDVDQRNAAALLDLMEEIAPSQNLRDEAGGWRHEPATQDRFMYIVDRIGKGRLAQRLARVELTAPEYVGEAVDYLVE